MKLEILKKAIESGQRQLSEHQSKLFLKQFGLPITREILVNSIQDAKIASQEIGYPLVMKIDSPHVAHKTEKGLVITNVGSEAALEEAWKTLMERHPISQGEGVLIQEMVDGKRELAMGLTRDPQFGPCVMFGLGGIFLEVLNDVTFRVAPLEVMDAMEMLEEIRAKRLLDQVRGMPAADREKLSEMLVRLGEIGIQHGEIKEIDLNPVILKGPHPVIVDALIVL
jgi:acetyl-CoA synthetase (ADP-forming)